MRSSTLKVLGILLLTIFTLLVFVRPHLKGQSQPQPIVVEKNIVEEVKHEEPKVDYRIQAIDGYFSRYKAPLASHGDDFVKAADKYGLDYRLLPAIAMKESTGGIYVPRRTVNGVRYGYNAFGWTCNSTYVCFGSWEEAIEFVGNQLTFGGPYKGRDTYGKLYSYNGAVDPLYPSRVIGIMNQIGQ